MLDGLSYLLVKPPSVVLILRQNLLMLSRNILLNWNVMMRTVNSLEVLMMRIRNGLTEWLMPINYWLLNPRNNLLESSRLLVMVRVMERLLDSWNRVNAMAAVSFMS